MKIYRWYDEDGILGYGGIVVADSEKIAREKLLKEISVYTPIYEEERLKTWLLNNDEEVEIFELIGILITH